MPSARELLGPGGPLAQGLEGYEDREGQLEMAGFGASGFAGAWLDCKCVEPIVVPQENDGSPTTIPFRDRRASRFADQVARRHEGAFGLGRLWVILA